jgi:(p)ppGpp synthase/HD superfamily hydrolase
MNMIDQAIEFAARAHRSQYRKGTDIPYISHPYGVGMLLLKAGCKEEVIIAGILHDTLEDTDTTEDDLLNHFGQEVLMIVKGCSEPNKDESWEARKKHTHDFLKHASLSIRQVACADKLHNLRSIRRDLETMGESAWDKFKRGRELQKWYYTELVESLGYSSTFPLLDVLRDEAAEVFTFPLENES